MDDEQLLKSIAQQYANYYSFSNSTNEQAKNIDDTIEYMLARIDEFGAFIETIKKDTDKTENKLIPLLYEKTQQVQQLFPLIDKLQELVDDINKNITTVEDRLNNAEKHVGTLVGKSNPFKWVLSHLQKDDDVLQQIKNTNSAAMANANKQHNQPQIEVHNTTEFFKQLRQDMQQVYQDTESTTPNITATTTTTTQQ
eukprot:gene4314-5399_t